MNKEIKKGSTVICIDNSNFSSAQGKIPPLKIGAKYIVSNIYICSCGIKSYDVGIISFNPTVGTSCGCRKEILLDISTHWCDERRFGLVEEDKNEAQEAVFIDNTELVKSINFQLS